MGFTRLKRGACGLALAGVMALGARGAATRPAGAGERIAAEAERIVAAAKESHYSHRTVVNEAAGRFDMDCSGLAVYVLRRVARAHLESVATDGHKRALALQFYEAFTGEPPAAGWTRVARAAEMRRGDLLAWRRVQQAPGQDTGHVMIVVGEPIVETAGRVRVEVIDSTLSPHAEDTRAKGTGGVGRGTIWLDVDDRGAPVAFHWSNPRGKARIVPISIGRAVD